MSDANKTAAAIMAAEASRQKRELSRALSARPPETYDVPGDMWALFEGFMDMLERRDRQRS